MRLDKLLVTLGLASTRVHAAELVRLGKVVLDVCAPNATSACVPTKLVPSTVADWNLLRPRVTIDVSEGPYGFGAVSRAAIKLRKSLDMFKHQVYVHEQTCLDIGSSTGGFTHELLRRGASHVIACDVGTEQLHSSLRCDPRVTVKEGTDFRNMRMADAAHHLEKTTIATIDVSFISVSKLLGAFAKSGQLAAVPLQHLIMLVKPQYELELLDTGKRKRIVPKQDEAFFQAILTRHTETCSAIVGPKLAMSEIVFPEIVGRDGSVEFVAHYRSSEPSALSPSGSPFSSLDQTAAMIAQVSRTACSYLEHH
eukprot:ANDGO_05059.mRNA.1 16S/23S rRNA (cytidine-2'-O)-methyltransferase TlyA